MNIYISDLDGTLLDNDACLSAKAKQSILKYHQKNILFTAASARCFITMKEAVGHDLKFKLPFIEFNGSYITDYHNNEIIQTQSIENNILPEVYSELKKLDIDPIISGNFIHEQDFKKRYFCYISATSNEALKKFQYDRYFANDFRIHLKTKMEVDPENENVVTLTLIDKKEKLQEFAKKIEDSYKDYLNCYLLEDQYNVGWHWLLVQSVQSTKANAIQKMIHHYDLKNHKIVAFGDNYNDMEMLKQADVSVCPSNAVSEIKETCDIVLEQSNEEDAVINYINSMEKI